jgi:hypothetical protein
MHMQKLRHLAQGTVLQIQYARFSSTEFASKFVSVLHTGAAPVGLPPNAARHDPNYEALAR